MSVEEGRELRDEALRVLEVSASEWIEAHAIPAIEALCTRLQFITTDDVWKECGTTVGEPRAMGAAMSKARKLRLILPTGTYRQSARSRCHARPIQIWRPL